MHSVLPVLAPGEEDCLHIGFGSGWAVGGGPKVPEARMVPGTAMVENALVRGMARVVYHDIEDRWWSTACEVQITPPRIPGQGWGEALRPIVLNYSKHEVTQVSKGL